MSRVESTAPPLRVAGILIRARHPRTLARWWGDTLEVEFDLEAEEGRFARVDGPGGMLQLAIVPAPDVMPPLVLSPVTVTFAVDGFDARIARLRERGDLIRVETIPDWGRFAHLCDPEGNELALWDAHPAKIT